MKICLNEEGFRTRCKNCGKREATTMLLKDDNSIFFLTCTICADELWELLGRGGRL